MNYLFIYFDSPSNDKIINKFKKLKCNVTDIYFKDIKQDNLKELTICDALILGPDRPINLTTLNDLPKKLDIVANLYNLYKNKKVLGICFGCQLLGVLNKCVVDKLDTPLLKVKIKTNLSKKYKISKNIKKDIFQYNNKRAIVKPHKNVSVLAKNEHGIMGIKIKGKKHYGLQFHPEQSGLQGFEIFENFVNLK